MSTQLLRAAQILRLQAAAGQQIRLNGTVKSFFQQVQEQIDRNPELKKGLDSVKSSAQSASDTLKQAADAAKQTAAQAAARVSQQEGQAGGPGNASAAARDQTSTASTSAPGGAGQQQQQAAAGAAGAQAKPGGASGTRQAGGGKAGAGAAPKAGASSRLWQFIGAIKDEVAAAVLPRPRTESATRARPEGLRSKPSAAGAGAGPAQIMVVEERVPTWRKYWLGMQAKLGANPRLKRVWDGAKVLRENPVVEKGRNLREDLRERWETADNPVVHKIQDIQDSWATESESALALREIRARDPRFDMIRFLYDLKADVPTVIRAFLTGDTATLAQHCTSDCLERLTAMIRQQEAAGAFSDPTILDNSDVELADLKFLEDDPIVVVQFQVQQIDCARDKFGNVVEGSPDNVQRLYYFWALQQEDAGFVGSDGKHYPPRWQLKEMLVRGMHKLL